MTIDEQVLRRMRRRNAFQTAVLFASLVLIFGVIAYLFLGPRGLVWILVLAAVGALLRPRVPTGWVLQMYRAQPLPRDAAPDLHRTIEALAQRARLPRSPAVYYVPSRMANAFATGTRDDAAIGVTDGILRALTPRQLIGVLGHEISHIVAGDVRITNLADALSRLVQFISYGGMGLVFVTLPLTLTGDLRPLVAGLLLIALPTVSTLLQLALSRAREYDADIAGAALTGDPEGLASGLEALERAEGAVWERLMVPRQQVPDLALLKSHPPTQERTRRLRALGSGGEGKGSPPGATEGAAVWAPPTYDPVREKPRWHLPGIRW